MLTRVVLLLLCGVRLYVGLMDDDEEGGEMEIDEPRWVTVAEYAKLKSMTEETVRRLCREGKLPAESFGKDWRIYYAPPADAYLMSKAVQETCSVSFDACMEMLDAVESLALKMKADLLKVKEKYVRESA